MPDVQASGRDHAGAARSTDAYGIQRQQHAMTCWFMACEGAKDEEGAAARSVRAVRTTSGSAVARRPVLVMVCPSGCATAAQCRRRVRRNHVRTITEAC